MKERNKIWVTVVLILAAVLTSFSLYIYTTEAGLHYLIVVYDSVLLLILAAIAYFITKKIQILNFTPFVLAGISFLTFIFTISLGDTAILFGFIVSALGLSLILVLLYLLWDSQKRTKLSETMKNYLG
jgi:hypothetical protein